MDDRERFRKAIPAPGGVKFKRKIDLMLQSAAAIICFLSVAMGAFGAHGLEGKLSMEAQNWWDTATFYALPHGVATFTLAKLDQPEKLPGWLFVIGALLFSGSLYAMALGAPRWFGAITPLGGLAFLAGWAVLALSGLKRT